MADPVPDLCEPVYGYRLWRVEPEGVGLISGNANVDLGNEIRWPPYQRLEARHGTYLRSPGFLPGADDDIRQQREQCLAPPCAVHVPTVLPGCGIYAGRTVADFAEMFSGGSGAYPRMVVGRVALWGRVAVHYWGYRAQYAYPKEFMAGTGVDVAAVAAYYGVPYTEDRAWKSVLKNDDWSVNLSSLPSRPSPGQWIVHQNSIQWTPLPPPPPIPFQPNTATNLTIVSSHPTDPRRHP